MLQIELKLRRTAGHIPLMEFNKRLDHGYTVSVFGRFIILTVIKDLNFTKIFCFDNNAAMGNFLGLLDLRLLLIFYLNVDLTWGEDLP